MIFRRKDKSPLDGSGVEQIYSTRCALNEDCDSMMERCRYQVDVIGFGQKTFRETQTALVEDMLRRGIHIRFLTMHPDSSFLCQRELEEHKQPGQIRKTILDLIAWANALNAKGYPGHISIKGYSCMTLNFYWRVDDVAFIGPYHYGKSSQQTISCRCGQGSVFSTYAAYYESLWNGEVSTAIVE